MKKPKLKWFREGYEPHEDQFLLPVGQERDEHDDLNKDAAVAWIEIGYGNHRDFRSRGGEGTSRPDTYVARVRDGGRERVITEGADALANRGLFSDKYHKAFSSLRRAKQAVDAELVKLEAQPTEDPSTGTVEHHARKKSSAQLDHEIARILARR